jgi:hypothetical protein
VVEAFAGMGSGVAGMADLARASLATTSLVNETSRRVGFVPTLTEGKAAT